tara:strand:+ start:708 stop:1205 length:498 start_codon:yes stop_codon:yes gene_type:complete
MGRLKFEVNLPSLFGKKTIANFNLDKKFFEFSDYFLIDNYSVDCAVVIEKKNAFWQLDIEIRGLANTYCDRCGDPLLLKLKGSDVYFLKKEEDGSSQSHNVIYITHSTEPVNLESVLKEVLFFVIPKTKVHKENDCNLDVLKKLDSYQKKNNKIFLSDHLKGKLK